MAILLPVLLLGGAVWLGRSLQPADDGTVRPTQNGMVGASETPVPGPTEGPDGGETPDRPFTTFTVVLPTDDGKMERKSIPVPKNTPAASDPAAARDQWANIALNTLLSGEAKSFFPAGTQPAGPVTVESDALTVNLNAAFATGADSWSSAEAIARVMSIVNTVAATDQQITGRVTPVRVLIDGKPVSTLGPLDTAEPMMPDSALVPAS